MFNSLLEKKNVKMVDGSACKIIDTGTVNVTGRDGTVRALEAVRYVPKARYNLISIRVLDEECNTPIPRIRGRYGDVHTQGGDTLTWVR